MTPDGRVLAVVVCGAGPAAAVGTLVGLARGRGWAVQIIATPAALEFFDQAAIQQQTGHPVRSQYAKPGAPRSLIPDTILVAPATYNTINKWALGISDTYALGVLAETTGLGVPTVVLPFVNSALAGRAPFQRSVESLRAEGVRILLGPGGFEPHAPRAGGNLIDSYPWHLGLDEAERMLSSAPQRPRRSGSGPQPLCLPCAYQRAMSPFRVRPGRKRRTVGCSGRLHFRFRAEPLRQHRIQPSRPTGHQSPAAYS